MPYIYSKYRIVWSKDHNSRQYTLELMASGTAEELAVGKAGASGVRANFRANMRRQIKTDKAMCVIWERELHLEPGEAEPKNDGLPDKLSIPPKRRHNGGRSRNYNVKSEPWTGDAEALRRDVSILTHLNADRQAHGQRPLSYGYWRAGIR